MVEIETKWNNSTLKKKEKCEINTDETKITAMSTIFTRNVSKHCLHYSGGSRQTCKTLQAMLADIFSKRTCHPIELKLGYKNKGSLQTQSPKVGKKNQCFIANPKAIPN